ncbi:hypothetical protein RIF29_41049 [Crotalaria pallida]|uniref:Uncharacterized protein n=1 Tax=Crotalaria pallida TaxID=3830 RepID=A0AAN9E4M8_CROPI
MPKQKKKPSSSSSTSERKNWDNIFNSLVQMVRNQQSQLQSLATQHKFLQERFSMQHDNWAYDIRTRNDQISQLQRTLMAAEKKRLLEMATADMVLGSTHKEASVLKWILEQTEDELKDFKACFECLSSKSSDGGEGQETVFKDSDMRKKGIFKESGKKKKGTTGSENKSTWTDADEEKCSKKIKDELRRLKGECEKLSLEKKFVWNQYNRTENDYSNKLRTKQAEVEKVNEKIKMLVSSMEQLQSENNKKDSTISQLESKVADLEAEAKRLKEEISGLSVELDSVRKSRNNRVTPVLNRCTEGAKNSDSGASKASSRRRNVSMKKEISAPSALVPAPSALVPANLSDKGNRGRKRKEGPAVPISETPKLFSSRFKVPKLKSSSRVS